MRREQRLRLKRHIDGANADGAAGARDHECGQHIIYPERCRNIHRHRDRFRDDDIQRHLRQLSVVGIDRLCERHYFRHTAEHHGFAVHVHDSSEQRRRLARDAKLHADGGIRPDQSLTEFHRLPGIHLHDDFSGKTL